MNQERGIRSIAVAGGGIVGLSAAIAFARALPGTTVTLIEAAPDPAALADCLPTAQPSITHFHQRIGLDECALVREGIATHHLGTVFEGWPASERPWIQAFGPYGKPAGAIAFDQVWVRAQRAERALPYDQYSMGAALAHKGKFVHPAEDPNFVGSRFRYGLRLDPALYRERLKAQALASGVALVFAEVGDSERREGGGITALRLTNGERIAADLFVDCTGPSARLLSMLDDNFEDWSAWMPFDRLRLESAPGDATPGTADRVSASEHGWTITCPLAGSTMSARVAADAEGTSITRGRRPRPWVANVLAIGDSATALDPLHGFHLELAQMAILLALELLPGRDFRTVETDEYNRRAERVTRRIRDFIALHYLRSGRWSDMASVEPPDTLALTLDQYEHRGRLPFHEEESIPRDSWASALLGLGVIPRNIDPQSAIVDLEEAANAMDRLAQQIAETVEPLPSYADYLARMRR